MLGRLLPTCWLLSIHANQHLVVSHDLCKDDACNLKDGNLFLQISQQWGGQARRAGLDHIASGSYLGITCQCLVVLGCGIVLVTSCCVAHSASGGNGNADKPKLVYSTHEKTFISRLVLLFSLWEYVSTEQYLANMHRMQADLGASYEQMSWSIPFLWIVKGIVGLPIGMISDRMGRRSTLLFCFALLPVSLMACACAPNIHWFLAARLLQGFSEGSTVLQGSILRDLYEDPSDLLVSYTELSVLQMFGPMLSAALGGMLGVWLGWRTIFMCLVPMVLACWLVLFRHLPETLASQSSFGGNSWKGVALVCNMRMLALMVSPGMLGIGGVINVFLSNSPLILQESFGATALQVSLFLGVSILLIIPGPIVHRHLMDRLGLGPLTSTRIASLYLIVPLILFVLVGTIPIGSTWRSWAFIVAQGLYNLLFLPFSIGATVLFWQPLKESFGMTGAIYSCCQQTGALFFSFPAEFFIRQGSHFQNYCLWCAGLLAAALVLFWLAAAGTASDCLSAVESEGKSKGFQENKKAYGSDQWAGRPGESEEVRKIDDNGKHCERDENTSSEASHMDQPTDIVGYIFAHNAHESDKSLQAVTCLEDAQCASLTYTDLFRDICIFANHVQQVCGPGALLLMMRNTTKHIVVLLGGLAAGRQLRTVSPQAANYFLDLVLDDSGIRHAFTEKQLLANIQDAADRAKLQLGIILVDDGGNMFFQEVEKMPLPPRLRRDPKLPSLVCYSSGTTGKPKSVLHSHETFLASLPSVSKHLFQGERQVVFCGTPLCHVWGLLSVFGCLSARDRVITMASFNASSMLDALESYQVQVCAVSPPVVQFFAEDRRVMDYKLASLKTIISAGSSLSEVTRSRCKERLQHIRGTAEAVSIVSHYGMTETLMVTRAPAAKEDSNTGLGDVLPHVQAKLVCTTTGEQVCEAGRPGELLVKSPSLMLGYGGNAQETPFTLDGWFRTGDVGYFDSNNMLYLTSRAKDIIKVDAVQVCPDSLEDLIRGQPGVEDVAVFAVPDDGAGHRPAAVVSFASTAGSVDCVALRDHVNLQLPLYQRIKYLQRGNVLRSSAGKLLRHQMQQEFCALTTDGPASDVIDLIADSLLLSKTRITMDTELQELGLNSIQLVRLLAEIETKKGVRINFGQAHPGLSVNEFLCGLQSTEPSQVCLLSDPQAPRTTPKTTRVQCTNASGLHCISYDVYGSVDNSKAVIVLHTLSARPQRNLGLVQALSSQFRVITPSLAGHAPSDCLSAGDHYTIRQFAADVEVVIAQEGPFDFLAVVGISLGGWVGMQLAAKDCSVIDALVLNDLAPVVPEHYWPALQLWAEGVKSTECRFCTELEAQNFVRATFGKFAWTASEEVLSDWARREVIYDSNNRQWTLIFDHKVAENALQTIRCSGNPFNQDDGWDLLAKIRIPTFLLYGDEGMTTASLRQRMVSTSPRMSLHELIGVGHTPQFCHPGTIDPVVEWIQSQVREKYVHSG
eukprot:TRINITY_DN15601_c0_g1_i4.p1 TRINITY_DN15601_c0_g1~~TRINITY_DN15601_c0_g1_i4.p1  ORF type:complete len:1474 (-),score=167.05 TRINITY_DN15601_c0_g1_i4:119-4540(-)